MTEPKATKAVAKSTKAVTKAAAKATKAAAKATKKSAPVVVSPPAPPAPSAPSAPSAPEIALVIPTYQNAGLIRTIVEGLSEQTLGSERYEVIVVDDCSTDSTVAELQELSRTLPYRLSVLQTPVNRGPAAARNIGWQNTEAPFVAFIDDDCTPSPHYLEEGLLAFHEQTGAGVIQGRTHTPGEVSVRGLTDWWLWRVVEGPTAFFEGCNLFFRRHLLELTGGFDEEIRYYGEDTAAGWKVLEAGFGQGFAPKASVSHPVEQRGFRWFVRNGYLESRVVACAAKHPGFRQAAFWRPWAFRKEEPALVVAVFGLLVARRFRPALLLALPYLWWRRPSVRHLNFFRLCLQVPAVDAARLAGHLRGSMENRVFVL